MNTIKIDFKQFKYLTDYQNVQRTFCGDWGVKNNIGNNTNLKDYTQNIRKSLQKSRATSVVLSDVVEFKTNNQKKRNEELINMI